jgi:hypothetical protein
MAIMALQAFFENLSILHEIHECHKASFSSSSSSSWSSSSSLSHFIEGKKGGEEGQGHNAIICFDIVCDNAVTPSKALLRKQRRKSQLQHLKERRRLQQHRPIYNRSISVNSFAFSTSSRQPTPSTQSRNADKALSLFFNDIYTLSPDPASKTAASPASSPPQCQREELKTRKAGRAHDLKTALIVPRRISPVSVMDSSLLQSPPTKSPSVLAYDSLQLCDTPKIKNSSVTFYYAKLIERGDGVPLQFVPHDGGHPYESKEGNGSSLQGHFTTDRSLVPFATRK